MDALGRLFDVGLGWAPVDLDAADGSTGKRIYIGDCGSIAFLMVCGTGPATFSLDVQQHTAYTSGTTADLDVVTYCYYKSEAALDNDESWTKLTQSAASEITLDAIGLVQKIVVVEVDAAQLSDGYAWVSLNSVSANGTAHLSSCVYLKHDLHSQRAPANLPNLLRPGAANA